MSEENEDDDKKKGEPDWTGADPPGRVEIGPHRWFAGPRRLIEEHIREVYADGLRADAVMGYTTIVLRFDPNTGERVGQPLYNAPELKPAIDEIEDHAILNNSKLHLAFDRVVGGAPVMVENDLGDEHVQKEARTGVSKDYLNDCLFVAKLLFGTLPGAKQANDNAADVEAELRTYHERGNLLPLGVRRHLVSKAPLPAFGREVPTDLRPRLPFVFDPTDVPSLWKVKYKLAQEKKGAPLTIKQLSAANHEKMSAVGKTNMSKAHAKREAEKLAAAARVPLADLARGARDDA
jgi:hypothetical protein